MVIGCYWVTILDEIILDDFGFLREFFDHCFQASAANPIIQGLFGVTCFSNGFEAKTFETLEFIDWHLPIWMFTKVHWPAPFDR